LRIAGIIAEYDPFHKGHAAHIAATRAADGGRATHVVAVMSGSFTQRGEPALVDKFTRSQMALAGGVDLVIELPLPWAMAPAENFALGGVAILNVLGCVDLISFGSECGDISLLKELAALSADQVYQTKLKHHLASGLPYAAASQAAAADIVGDEASTALASPNNTLGIEYLRAMARLGSKMDAFSLLRQGALHNENTPNNGFASASMIRDAIRDGNVDNALSYVPNNVKAILKQAIRSGKAPMHKEMLEQASLAILRKMNEDDLSRLPWLSEGLENRLYKAIRSASSFNELLEMIKTKRYPSARLRRILWSAVLGIQATDADGLPPYIRVLATNERGREVLSAASPTLPILTRSTQLNNMSETARRVFELECTATDLHALGMPSPAPCGTDYTTKFISID